MSDRIELRGLRVVGTHGVLDEERQRAQPFDVDVVLAVDLAPAGASDDLADTVDYGAVTNAAAAEVAGAHADLIEHLAERIATSVLAVAARADAVQVTVTKVRPPVAHDLATAAVTISRTRRPSPGPPAPASLLEPDPAGP